MIASIIASTGSDGSFSVINALAMILALGVGAQWIAWRLKLPSILLLLAFGFLSGPVVTNLLNPDETFGDLLLPIVSLAVAIILYEGGLSLHARELGNKARVVWLLVTVGALVTWILTSVAAHFIIQLSWPISILLGGVLVVTGPTVIQPLLRHIRPNGPVGPILRWEGIVIDPIGALLAVVVFDSILIGTAQEAAMTVVLVVVKTIVVGSVLGIVAGFILAILIRRFLIADHLENAVSLMLVVLVYALSDRIQPESGLAAATVMGIFLANQKLADIEHIVEFKENLQVLIISMLFIVLAARIQPEDFKSIGIGAAFFVGIVILVVRPASVFLSTLGSKLQLREKLFLSWMAPRGIVAAAVSSVFSLRLVEAGYAEAAQLVPLTFVVIVVTVLLYGLTAPRAAYKLGLADPNPQGILFVGATEWVRQFAEVLQEHKVRVFLVDMNRANIAAAKLQGIRGYAGSILSEHALEKVELAGLGRVLAVTPNSWVNTLTTQRLESIFGRANCYQLPPNRKSQKDGGHQHLDGRWLFGEDVTHAEIRRRVSEGGAIKATPLTEEFTFEDFEKHYGGSATPLVALAAEGKVRILTAEQSEPPKPGEIVVAVVDASHV